jgi:hypothetical protein
MEDNIEARAEYLAYRLLTAFQGLALAHRNTFASDESLAFGCARQDLTTKYEPTLPSTSLRPMRLSPHLVPTPKLTIKPAPPLRLPLLPLTLRRPRSWLLCLLKSTGKADTEVHHIENHKPLCRRQHRQRRASRSCCGHEEQIRQYRSTVPVQGAPGGPSAASYSQPLSRARLAAHRTNITALHGA